MHLQLSVEFLIYLAICGVALLVSVAALSTYLRSLSGSSSAQANSTFAWLLSSAEYSGVSNFSAYVPSGICASGSPPQLTPENSGYYLPEAVGLDRASLCPSGRSEQLTLEESNGSVVLR